MSIISLNTLEANGFKAKLSNKLKFYKGDKLNLSFSISNGLISEIDSQEVINGILPINSIKIEAYMLIGSNKVAGTIIENNNIIFRFTPEYQEIGINQFQIVIIELQDDGSKEILHTPPFTIEVAEPIGVIGEEDNNDVDVARVNYAIVNKSIVGSNETTYISIDEEYKMNVWVAGDVITAEKLNNMETALLKHAQLLDELSYKAITINDFNISQYMAEIGQIVSNIILSWSYNKEPLVQKINNNIIDNSIREYLVNSSIVSNTIFTLNASDGKTDADRSASISFYNGKYIGVGEESSYDSSFILGLNKTLVPSRTGSFTVTSSIGQYIYFAIPLSFGIPVFTVGGFTGGFNLVKTIDFENKFGHIEKYNIWKSDNSNLGNVTVDVR